MNSFDQTDYNNGGTIIDQAFNHGTEPTAPPPPPLTAQEMMTTMPTMPMNNENQMVPNVMMDMPDEQFQQKNAQADYMNSQQIGFAPGEQLQPGTYDLNVPPFDIEDPLLRREYFRMVFKILLLQVLCALPIMEIFLLCTSDPIPHAVYSSFMLFCFLMFIPMYIFSEYRRHAPVNYMVLIFTTLAGGILAGMHATHVGNIAAIVTQLTMVAQLLFMIGFAKQTRFKFNNLNGILFTLFIYLVTATFTDIFTIHFPMLLEFFYAFIIVYCIYDMQLQLSGHHRYNLKAEEYIFGACNIYADIPELHWRFFRYIFLDHFIRIYQFFKKCCFAEVC